MAEQGSERHDDEGQHREVDERARIRWTPAANDGDGQHDRESFNRLRRQSPRTRTNCCFPVS
jgi:hypothetical protein